MKRTNGPIVKTACILLMMLLGSCYKAEHITYTSTTPAYRVIASGEGVNYGSIADSSLTFKINDSGTLSIGLNFSIISGNPGNYPITTFITGLPAGITSAQDSITFKLNFTAGYSFTVNCDTGLYNFNINIATTAGTQTYIEHIHVLPVVDYAPSIADTYYCNDPCGYYSLGSTWYSYTSEIATVPGRPHWVSMQNFRGTGNGFYVYAFVTGSGGYLGFTVPLQTVNGYTIYGTGQSTPDTGPNGNEKPAIDIYDTVVNLGDTQTCITQMRQHTW